MGKRLITWKKVCSTNGEARTAEYPKDFIHKLRISLKELRETQRWLKPVHRVPRIKKPERINDAQKCLEFM